MSLKAKTFGGPVAQGWEDEGLLSAFNRDFGMSLADVAVVRKLLGTAPVRAWYAQWKEARAEALAVPIHWQELGLTPSQWSEAQAGLKARREARARYAGAVDSASRTFKAAVARADATLAGELAANDAPLLRALELGYEDLTLEELIQVESATADRRDAVLQALLNKKRRDAIAALQPGPPPR